MEKFEDRYEILLIEDNPGDVRLIRELFRELPGLSFVSVDSLKKAAAQPELRNPGLILLDLGLPESQGLDSLREVLGMFPGLPVIVLTGLDDKSIALEAIKSGAQDYLLKGSFDAGLLQRSIHYAIERKKMESEMEQRVLDRTAELQMINRELEAFSYSVSHDLRAPLRAIDGFTTILVQDYGSRFDGEGQELCSRILDGTRQMSRLIDDLLTFSRMGRKEIARTLIPMKELVLSVFEELTTPTLKTRIDLSVDEMDSVMGDRMLLHQVWYNLLSNAIKYSGKRDRIRIHVGSELLGRELVFRVSDNGAGFDMNYSSKLFNVFQRLHSAREFDGTGVGLAIVQRIVHRHGGTVWAEGKVNEGATFYFSLPAYFGQPA
ncbi:MAG TPA: ATP-binding protein [Bacteroidales bacterium]|nr:ATP-binding protein [Bacteroidales bacterium]